MLNLYTPVTAKVTSEESFTDGEKLSVVYHDIFDYPLSFPDLIRWKSGKQLPITNYQFSINNKNGFYFIEGREGLIYKRLLRKRVSLKKLEIAKKASKVISLVPGVKMVAVTGSLAMGNSEESGDIDLMLVTKKGALWTTRLLVYLVLRIANYAVRSPGDKDQKDKLCLNMWFDESDLTIHDHNLYTAHEIAQIVPLVNKDKTYEKFLYKNKWILSFWPNAVRVQKSKNTKFRIQHSIFWLVEKLAFELQYLYMRSKMTREIATATRALFHPHDWGKIVLSRFTS